MTETTHRKVIIFLFILILSVSHLAFLAREVSAEVSINEMTPTEGHVGTEVNVIGQISTVNGSYEILFDGELAKNGTADLTAVSDTFIVPNSTAGLHEVRLRDVLNDTESAVWNFTIQTRYTIKAVTPPGPNQLQEGSNVTIVAMITGEEANKTDHARITLEDPANVTSSSEEILILTSLKGYWTTSKSYPSDFNGGNRTTFFVGDYEIALVKVSNETLATGNFTIGLTDASEYYRFQTVKIKALNFTVSEAFRIRITYEDEIVFESLPNVSGIVEANWTITANASLGSYKVEVSWKPFEKPVLDVQNFTVATKSFSCEVWAYNLDNELVSGVSVEARNLSNSTVDTETTSEGVASFYLEATNYTFVAFWNLSAPQRKQVGETSEISLIGNLTGDSAVNITCSLAHIRVAVKDESGAPLPSVELQTNFSYTSEIGGLDVPINGSLTYETDINGTTVFQNVFANINYSIEARRYQSLFNVTMVNVTSSVWLNITCPTYRLLMNVYGRDGADSPLQDAQVKVYEWSIGKNAPEDSYAKWNVTDLNGNVEFDLIFGKYGVLIYVNDALLNETWVILDVPHTVFNVSCSLYPLTLNIRVVDYFGQAIPNANVTVEREGVPLSSATTEGDGVAQFLDLVGGNYKAFVFMEGKPYEIATFSLIEPRTVTLKIASVVSLGGLLTQMTHFIIIVFVLILAVAFSLSLVYRRLKARQVNE